MGERFTDAFQGMWDKLGSWFDAFITNIPNIIIAILVFGIAYRLSKIVKRWSMKALSKTGFTDSLKDLVAGAVSFIVIIGGLILAMVVMNLEGALSGILMAAGVSGLVIGLALQSPLSNSFAGMILSIKDYVNVGDFIETQGIEGQVKEISLRNTTIQTIENDVMFLPNREILDNPLKNSSLAKRNRMIINCGVAYDSDLDEVEKLTIQTLGNTYEQAEDEEIEFFYTDFGDSSINFETRYWVDADSPSEEMHAKHMGIKAIKKAFDAHNINIPFPMRTIEYTGNSPSKS